MKSKLKRWLPTAASIQNNRWLKWLGPALQHPGVWRLSRKGMALGVAIGLFFGFLAPVAQIPFSATAAVMLRANLPMAVAGTFITNPVTFAPIYYAAYRIGAAILREDVVTEEQAPEVIEKLEQFEQEFEQQLEQRAEYDHHDDDFDEALSFVQRIKVWLTHLGAIGKPLILGLAILATIVGVGSYFLISALWILKVRWTRRRRLSRKRPPGGR